MNIFDKMKIVDAEIEVLTVLLKKDNLESNEKIGVIQRLLELNHEYDRLNEEVRTRHYFVIE